MYGYNWTVTPKTASTAQAINDAIASQLAQPDGRLRHLQTERALWRSAVVNLAAEKIDYEAAIQAAINEIGLALNREA